MAMPRRQHMITNWDDVPVVMDLAMVGRLLGMNYVTLKSHCAKGKIPAVKVGGSWRVNKQQLMRHLGVEV